MRILFVALHLSVFSACTSSDTELPLTPDANTNDIFSDITPDSDISDTATSDISNGEDVDTSTNAPCGGTCLLGELCIDNQCVCDPSPVSFKEDLVKPMQTTCGPGCHVSEEAHGGYQDLNLHENFAYAELINVPTTACAGARVRVSPGSIRDSYIYNKLTDTNLCDEGQAMPIGRLPWPEARIAALGRWICQGALNN